MNRSLEARRHFRIRAVGTQTAERPAQAATAPGGRYDPRDRTDRILFWSIWVLLVLFVLVVMRLA
jgi:hypothetical protein